MAVGCIDFGLDKTQWINTSRHHGTPNHPWLQKLQTLISKWNAKCNFIWKEDHWATVQLFFSLAQVRCFWRWFCFRSGLVALFLKMSERGDSWCTDSSFSSLLVKLSQVFEFSSYHLTYLQMFIHVYFLLKLVLKWRRWSGHARFVLPLLLNWGSLHIKQCHNVIYCLNIVKWTEFEIWGLVSYQK